MTTREQQPSEREEEITTIASLLENKFESSIQELEEMIYEWLEQKGNEERLMEKFRLQQDIGKINRKMDEIMEGMEVCGRREVSHVVNETVKRVIWDTLESQKV